MTKRTKATKVGEPKDFDKLSVEYVVKGSLKYNQHGTVDMLVKMSHIPEEIPLTAAADDLEHCSWLHSQAVAGKLGAIAEYERPLPTVEDLQEELDKLWPDVVLGIATEEELSLAKSLRIQIKAMSQ